MSGKSGVHLGLSFPEDFDVCRKSLTINDEDTARYPAVGAMTNTNSKRLTFQRIPHRPTSVLATANCWHVSFPSRQDPPGNNRRSSSDEGAKSTYATSLSLKERRASRRSLVS